MEGIWRPNEDEYNRIYRELVREFDFGDDKKRKEETFHGSNPGLLYRRRDRCP